MSQIQVRTARDAEIARREELLRQEQEREAINPFRTAVLAGSMSLWRTWDLLGAAGVLCVGMAFWNCFPVFARFRHQHIKRYRRRQVEFREGLFHSKNITKIRDPNENRSGWVNWAILLVMFRWFQIVSTPPDLPDFPM